MYGLAVSSQLFSFIPLFDLTNVSFPFFLFWYHILSDFMHNFELVSSPKENQKKKYDFFSYQMSSIRNKKSMQTNHIRPWIEWLNRLNEKAMEVQSEFNFSKTIESSILVKPFEKYFTNVLSISPVWHASTANHMKIHVNMHEKRK